MSLPLRTLPVALLHGALTAVTAKGHLSEDVIDTLLRNAGIAPALLRETGARITVLQYGDFIRLLAERLEDEALGFFSRPLRRGSFALVARATLGAPSLYLALRRAAHTFRVLQGDAAIFAVEDGPLTGVVLEFPNPEVGQHNFIHELLLRIFWQLLAWLNEGKLPPRRVDFSFDQPAYAALYALVFPAPLQFRQRRTAIWFDSAALKTPVRRDEEAFRIMMQKVPANVIVPQPGDQQTSARVRALLQQSEPEWPDLEAIARRIHWSTSTLQRRLAAEGTSFQNLKDQLRRDLAVERLTTTSMPLSYIAVQLGFADATAFSRAFKVWTGSTPRSYRQR